MDEQRTDAAGQAVALGEDIIAELRGALDFQESTPAPIPPPSVPEELPPLRPPLVTTVPEAVAIARETLREYERILEDQRKQVEVWQQSKKEDRTSSAEQRIAEIKARLEQQS